MQSPNLLTVEDLLFGTFKWNTWFLVHWTVKSTWFSRTRKTRARWTHPPCARPSKDYKLEQKKSKLPHRKTKEKRTDSVSLPIHSIYANLMVIQIDPISAVLQWCIGNRLLVPPWWHPKQSCLFSEFYDWINTRHLFLVLPKSAVYQHFTAFQTKGRLQQKRRPISQGFE